MKKGCITAVYQVELFSTSSSLFRPHSNDLGPHTFRPGFWYTDEEITIDLDVVLGGGFEVLEVEAG